MSRLRSLLQERFVRLGILLLALVFFGLHARNQYLASRSQGNAIAPYFPPEGIAVNDTHGRVPGNPDNGVRQLHQISHYISIYRERHPELPSPTVIDIERDIARNPEAYGVQAKDAWDLFTNPDTKYADGFAGTKNGDELARQTVSYVMSEKRPDGSAIGSAKQPGTRDVLAWTDMYHHMNIRIYKGDGGTISPVGVYLVLWDDGQVDKIPYNQVLMVPQGPGDYGVGFRGEAGLPSGVLTYAQYYKKNPVMFAKQ